MSSPPERQPTYQSTGLSLVSGCLAIYAYLIGARENSRGMLNNQPIAAICNSSRSNSNGRSNDSSLMIIIFPIFCSIIFLLQVFGFVYKPLIKCFEKDKQSSNETTLLLEPPDTEETPPKHNDTCCSLLSLTLSSPIVLTVNLLTLLIDFQESFFIWSKSLLLLSCRLNWAEAQWGRELIYGIIALSLFFDLFYRGLGENPEIASSIFELNCQSARLCRQNLKIEAYGKLNKQFSNVAPCLSFFMAFMGTFFHVLEHSLGILCFFWGISQKTPYTVIGLGLAFLNLIVTFLPTLAFEGQNEKHTHRIVSCFTKQYDGNKTTIAPGWLFALKLVCILNPLGAAFDMASPFINNQDPWAPRGLLKTIMVVLAVICFFLSNFLTESIELIGQVLDLELTKGSQPIAEEDLNPAQKITNCFLKNQEQTETKTLSGV